MPGPQIRVLANKNGGGIKTIHCLHSRKFGVFECNHMPFGLCNVLARFQWLMHNFLGEIILIYCLIYLDDIIIFSWMTKEHLHRLHVVSDQFRECNLKLRQTKCNLFKEEINYIVHWVSKGGVQSTDLNLRAIKEVYCAKPTWKYKSFSALWATISSS